MKSQQTQKGPLPDGQRPRSPLKCAPAGARAITGRAPADRTRAYFLYVVISGLVGWIFFAFFKVFLAMLFSLT
jgi:hypothetical protein